MTSHAPRRRHSPAVYRRRRLGVLLVLILIVAAVWLLIARPWESSAAEPKTAATGIANDSGPSTLPVPVMGTPSPTPVKQATPTPTPTSTTPRSPSPTPTATKAAAAPCTSANVTVEAVTDLGEYPAGKDPKLFIKLTNHGDDCTMNVGTTTQKFTITSGPDTWWRSTDCQSAPSDMVVLIKAGKTVQSASPVVWNRTRSAVSTCGSKDRPKAPGGGASYHLDVEIGGIQSEESKLFLLY